MHLVFSDEPLPLSVTQSIFLEGPSPRRQGIKDWKVEAVNLLEKMGYKGHVFIPRFRDDFFERSSSKTFDYDAQVEFERKARARADIVLIWLARDIKGEMPAFTTNFEMGEDYKRGNVVYGHPEDADKVSYMNLCAQLENLPTHTDLGTALSECLSRLGKGALREGGEATVPLYVWNHPAFKQWYQNLRSSGNRLYDLKVEWDLTIKGKLFSFVVKPKIWVAEDDIFKENESVHFRPAIQTVVPVYRKDGETYVALIREFRSTVNNAQGSVWEFPGGSSFSKEDPLEVACQELKEELGVSVNPSRLIPLGDAQLAATVSATVNNAYKVLLTDEEWDALPSSLEVRGVLEEGERVRVCKARLADVHKLPVDWSTLGLLYSAMQ